MLIQKITFKQNQDLFSFDIVVNDYGFSIYKSSDNKKCIATICYEEDGVYLMNRNTASDVSVIKIEPLDVYPDKLFSRRLASAMFKRYKKNMMYALPCYDERGNVFGIDIIICVVPQIPDKKEYYSKLMHISTLEDGCDVQLHFDVYGWNVNPFNQKTETPKMETYNIDDLEDLYGQIK